MIYILMVGNGGGGGYAPSVSTGGGGGSSGTQSSVLVPAHLLPDTLFLSLAMGQAPNNTATTVTSFASFVALAPVQGGPNQREVLCRAEGGSSGENDGPGGASVTATTLANMPLAGLGRETRLAGHAGTAGGVNAAGVALTLPTTGVIVTGGTGGGGKAAGDPAAGNAGGAITGAGVFNTIPGGVGGATGAANPGSAGNPGHEPFFGLQYGTGGTGGGATGGDAVPNYAAGGMGGSGAPGCGGGGGGGGLPTGAGGYGGPAFALIVAW